MKIVIAKTAGFCMGVRRAVEMVLDTNRRGDRPIHTYGPLIHNPQVLNIFEEKGISTLDDVPEKGRGSILIRAHGVPPDAKQKLAQAGFDVIDATCPRVIKVQTIIRKHAEKGYASIIIGDQDHPEVVGLMGYTGGNGHVVDNMDDLKALPEFENAIIVAQTTQNTSFFDQLVHWVEQRSPHYKIFNTICDSTEKRQAEVKRMAASVDALIVVGGYNSGNTKRLAEIARQAGKPVLHVETEADIDAKALSGAEHVGITAGASTPNWIIKRVYRKLETMPSKAQVAWRQAAFSAQRVLLLTNIYIALGAGALCFACAKLQGARNVIPQILISMLYVQSMHILNHLMGRKSDRFNDPERAEFYVRYQALLFALATLGGAVGLFTAYTLGGGPFLILLTMSILGLSYNLRVIPGELVRKSGMLRLKDIPGSKTVLIALAWGVVTSVFPAFGAPSEHFYAGTLAAFIWSSGLVFARTAFFEVLDMQGDRIVGKETIPILLGARRSMQLLKIMLLFLTAMVFFLSISGVFTSLGYGLAICPMLMLLVILANEKEVMLPGIKLEFILESMVVLSGVITFFWLCFH
ncbi:MAG: 4-hydroxy-3-methylbut-2-enyl diphosphate reductase [Thermodesulfobacteriota bacterium]